ncbi:MAG TPA: helix-turn-helix transcriptional regulator [Allosphingosinicella sp.]|nr:helix-turn-helix transcriptional regulator [Allosphingosinicella sp.]
MPESSMTLSDGQKACLRLVAQGMSSKEIAKALGLTPQTVDTYVKTSMARLGVTSRREAARILVASELSRKLGSPSARLADCGPESQMASTGTTGWLSWVRPPPVGGGFHDLNWSQKTYQALLVAVISASIVVALALLIAGLFQTFS